MLAKTTVFLAVATLVAIATVGGPTLSVARAALGSCSANANYLDYAQANGITQIGAKAEIDTMYPALCDSGSGSPGFSGGWTMESGADGCDGWAQVGYDHEGTNSPNGYRWAVFVQYAPYYAGAGCPPTVYTTKWFGSPSGSPSYKVDLKGNLYTDWFEMWAGQTLEANTNFDPRSWVGNWIPSFAGETAQCESDVPGLPSSPVGFRIVQKEANDTTWSSINDLHIKNPFPACSRYHIAWINQPASFKIWTDPLN